MRCFRWVCVRRPSGGSSPEGLANRMAIFLASSVVWHGISLVVLPAIPSTSLRAITPRQGGRTDGFGCGCPACGQGVAFAWAPCRGVIGLRQVDGMAGRQPVVWALRPARCVGSRPAFCVRAPRLSHRSVGASGRSSGPASIGLPVRAWLVQRRSGRGRLPLPGPGGGWGPGRTGWRGGRTCRVPRGRSR